MAVFETSATADGPHRVAPQVSRPWLYDTLKLFNGYLLGALEHDAEKRVPVFGKHHAPTIT